MYINLQQATIGPASENLPILPEVVNAGMYKLHRIIYLHNSFTMNFCRRIMRLNFSHATYEEADLRMKNLKLVYFYTRITNW